MPVASLPEVMDRAFEKRYGVAAFNTVDDVTMHGVISAAEQSKSPLIIQISVKTVKFWGAEVDPAHVHGHGDAGHACPWRCTSIIARTRRSRRRASRSAGIRCCSTARA